MIFVLRPHDIISAMTNRELHIARILKDKISRVTPLLDFKVFGSRARGDADEYSDLDIFVEVPILNGGLEEKIQHVAWEVGLDQMMFISVVVLSKFEMEDSPLRASPLVQNIREEGIRL